MSTELQPIDGATDATAESKRALIQEEVQRASARDLPSEKDVVGFKPYVDAVAAFLIDQRTKPPLTLSIEGEWGMGKSSFMRQLELVLRRKYGKRTVQFNAWRHDKDEALWASFAIEFARQIAPNGRIARLRKRLRLSWRRFNFVEGLPEVAKLIGLATLCAGGLVVVFWWLWTGGAEAPTWLRYIVGEVSLVFRAWIAALATILVSVPWIKKAIDFVGNPFKIDLKKFVETPGYQGRLPFLEQFHQDFKVVVDVYAGAEIDKVFVFVDDLDRCEIPKAAELMQALNLMIPEDSRIIFVLGMDRDKVAAGIAHRNAGILPLVVEAREQISVKDGVDSSQALAFGYSFLERFIQVPFRVPRMGEGGLAAFCSSLMEDPALLVQKSRLESESRESGFADWLDLSALFGADKPKSQRTMLVEFADADSPAVRAVVADFAPALGYNPRRLKQFLNAFRLGAYISSEVGHFDVDQNAKPSSYLNLKKLAKVVALEIWWPKLLEDIERDPDLVVQLEDKLKRPESGVSQIGSPAVHNWGSKDALMQVLAIGLQSGVDYSLVGLDIGKLRRLAPRVVRHSIVQDWHRRASAELKPVDGNIFSRAAQFLVRSQEAEARANLKALFTTERAFLQEKDRYDARFDVIGYMPESNKDGTRPLVPGSGWVGGARFIYTVELRGKEFYGYALGVSGGVRDVEYEVRSDGDWSGTPRRIAPAVVDSEVYRGLVGSGKGWSFGLRYPSNFAEEVSDKVDGMRTLQARDSSAQLRIGSFDGGQWEALYRASSVPPPERGRQVLECTKKRNFFAVKGYVNGNFFCQTAIRKRGVVVVLDFQCDVMAKVGYAVVLKRIVSSVYVDRTPRWVYVFGKLISKLMR